MRILGIVLATLIAGCLPAAGYQSSYQTGYATYGHAPQRAGTGVFFNGQELTAEQKHQLDLLVGVTVPAGRYWMDAQGNAGLEGQPAQVNLVELARAREGQHASSSGSKEPFSMYSTDSAGRGSSLVTDGDGCMIMSTPDGSLSSGC